MFGSRLRRRRATKVVTIKSRSHSGSSYSESTVDSGLTATWEQKNATVTDDIQGTYTETLDVFWFEPVDGSLPSISRGYVLIDNDSVRYEVQNVKKPGGDTIRLKVETKRLNWPI